MRLWFVDFVVFPAQALWSGQSEVILANRVLVGAHLGYSKASPFFLPEQLQCTLCWIEVVSRNSFEHRFR
jgi:hypothetical protein